MYLRSLVTCSCRIWLVGLPGNISDTIRSFPAAQGLSPEFFIYETLPDTTEHKPECIIFALTPGAVKKASGLAHEDTLLIGWCDSEDAVDDADFQELADLWESPGPKMLAHRYAWLQERIWNRYLAWLIYNYWQTTLNMVPDLMWYKNLGGLHLEVNKALADTVGKTVEDCRGKRHGYIWGLKPEEYEEGERVCLESDRKVVESGGLLVGAEQILDNGELCDLKTYKTPVFDREGNIIGTAGTAQDVTLLNRYHEKILDMAHKDDLTGLSNRRYFYEYISEYRKKQAVCIFSIDLDNFKNVNDTYGHHVGDEALKLVSDVLRESFPNAVVCRFGGDEFLALLLGSISEESAKFTAESFLERLRDRCQDREEFRDLTGSVGIAISYHIDLPIDTLIRESDRALYMAKEAGRNCVRTAWEIEES